MLLFLGICALWGITGTAIGRVLFLKRMGTSARYMMGESYEDRNHIVATEDLASAQTYGGWSIVFWPLTLSLYIIQAPTPTEVHNRKMQEIEQARAVLMKAAEEFDLKV